jgi:hypothetical protein
LVQTRAFTNRYQYATPFAGHHLIRSLDDDYWLLLAVVLDGIFGRQFLAAVRQQSDDLMTLPDWSSIAQLRDFL